MPKLINEIFVFVATDQNGDEGIPAFSADGVMMPLVGADADRVESLKIVARNLEKMSDRKIKLFRFTGKEEIPWQ